MLRFDQVSGFISFAADWKPSFFSLQAPLFRTSLFKPYRSLFKFALKLVFERSVLNGGLQRFRLRGCQCTRYSESSWGWQTQLGVKPSQNRIALVLLGALSVSLIGSVMRIARRREVEIGRMAKDTISLVTESCGSTRSCIFCRHHRRKDFQ